MRPFLAFSLVACATFGARAVVAEDAPTYTFPPKVTWKVGDVVTRTKAEKQVQKQKVTEGDVVRQDVTNSIETAFEAVCEVKEVDDAGESTKVLVYFKRWKRVVGDEVDDSLNQAHVEVTGTGGGKNVKVVTPDLKPSLEAAQWLDHEFGKGAGEREGKAAEAFNPTKPVAVGETWTPDLAKLREMFSNGGRLKFVDEKCTAALTLTAVEGKVGVVTLEFDGPGAPMPIPGGQLDWTEGGVFVIRATLRKGLEASVHEQGGRLTARLQGTATGPGGVTLVLDVDVTNDGAVVSGGEMPALAAPAAVK